MESGVTEEFEQAAKYVRTLSSVPVEKMLEFYGFFKQAREGPCDVPKPGFFDFEGKKKWQAWKDVGSIPQEEARIKYIAVLDELDPEWRDKTEQNDGVKKPKAGFGIAVSSMLAQGLEEDARLDPKDKTLFDWAKEGNVNRMRALLSSSSDRKSLLVSSEPGFGGLTLLHVAADRGHLDAVSCLVEEFGADVNVQDEDGQTPLHYASSCGHADIVKFLCAAGARVDLKDGDGMTPPQVAFDANIKDIFSDFVNVKN